MTSLQNAVFAAVLAKQNINNSKVKEEQNNSVIDRSIKQPPPPPQTSDHLKQIIISNLQAAAATKTTLGKRKSTKTPDDIKIVVATPKQQKQQQQQAGNKKSKAAASVPNNSNLILTDEQKAIVFTALPIEPGYLIRAVAAAGASKTTVVVEFAKVHPEFRIIYIVFNRKMKQAAEKKFKTCPNVKVHTYHSLSYHHITMALGYKTFFQGTGRKKYSFTDRFRDWMISSGAHFDFANENKFNRAADWHDSQYSRSMWVHVRYILSKFCLSADIAISKKHAIKLQNLYDKREEAVATGNIKLLRILQRYPLPDVEDCIKLAQYMMDCLMRQEYDVIDHDISVKLMHLLKIDLSSLYDIFALDEAQDAMPVIVSIIKQQPKLFRLVVGDPPQQINRWADAVNAMDELANDLSPEKIQNATLSQTFRFSQTLANFNNQLFQRLRYTQVKPIVSKVPHTTKIISYSLTEYRELAKYVLAELNDEIAFKRQKLVEAKIKKPKVKDLEIHMGVLSRTKMGVVAFIDAWISEMTEQKLSSKLFQMKSSETLTKSLDEFCKLGYMSDAQLESKRVELDYESAMDPHDMDIKSKIQMIQFLQAKYDRSSFICKMTALLHPRKVATEEKRIAAENDQYYYPGQDEEDEKKSPNELQFKIVLDLLTIHQSKGLEWDNVLLIDIERDMKTLMNEVQRQSTNWLISYEAEESLFLLYVACTRAKYRFYLPETLYQFIQNGCFQ